MEPEEAPPARHRRRDAALALALGVFLAWRGGAGTVELVGGLSAAGLRAPALTREERLANALGEDLALHEILRERTPEDARIFFHARREEGAATFLHMQALLYPRRFFPLEEIPRTVTGSLDDTVFLLDYGAPNDLEPPGFELVVRTQRFELRRAGGEGR